MPENVRQTAMTLFLMRQGYVTHFFCILSGFSCTQTNFSSIAFGLLSAAYPAALQAQFCRPRYGSALLPLAGGWLARV